MKPLIPPTETLKRETLGKYEFHLKSCNTMNYDITKTTAPAMPTLGRGTECIKILLFWHQKSCMNPWFRCFFLYWRINE